MSALCSRAAVVSLASSRSAPQPAPDRCWLTRSRTCCSTVSAPCCGEAPGTPVALGAIVDGDGFALGLALGDAAGERLGDALALGLTLLSPSSPAAREPA